MIEVEVELRSSVDRAFDVRERDVDLIGMFLRLTEEGASALAAEGPGAMCGGGIATELFTARVHFELGSGDGEPRDEAGPVVPTTHRAVTMATEEAGKAHSKAHRAT